MENILHTLNKPPSEKPLREQLLNTLQSGDTLLLIEDGVYYALGNAMNSFPNTINICLLNADLHARGVPESERADTVDYEQFVLLCTQHARVINWY